MDTTNEKIYNNNYQSKKGNLRNDVAFQNMIINPNAIYGIQPMPNLLYLENNFLSKKRGTTSATGNNTTNFDSNSKCKYLLSILNLFFEIL